ncbi:MAG: transcription-repair coupling factor [Magnetococcales bacterium]|nr:transcription-repair coupling factor [Magnetococcales bacterium]
MKPNRPISSLNPSVSLDCLPSRPGERGILQRCPLGAMAWLAAERARTRRGLTVLVTSRALQAEIVLREMMFHLPPAMRQEALWNFPAWEVLPYEPLSPFGPLVADRLSTLFRLLRLTGKVPFAMPSESGGMVVVTTPGGLMQRLMPADVLAAYGFQIRQGDAVDLEALRLYLVKAGYWASSQVKEAGEFAMRGGILDLFPAGADAPVRLEFFGDSVESLRLFDPVTQRSSDRIPGLDLLPVSEIIFNDASIARFRTAYRSEFGGASANDPLYRAVSQSERFPAMEHFLPLFYDTTLTFFDYLPADTLFLLDEEFDAEIRRRGAEIAERYQVRKAGGWSGESPLRMLPPEKFYLSVAQVEEALKTFALLEQGSGGEGTICDMGFSPPTLPGEEGAAGGVARWWPALSKALADGYEITLASRTLGQRLRLEEMLTAHHLPWVAEESWVQSGQRNRNTIHLTLGDLSLGCRQDEVRWWFIGEDLIFGRTSRRAKTDPRFLDQLLASFADLKDGDPVVHLDYGHGRYGGLMPLEVGGIRNDFLLLRYQDGDKLYVPVENLDRVNKYTGGEEPPLDKLGATRWEKVKAKAKSRILEMAAELVQLQALRQTAKAIAFSGEDPVYQEFAASFPFEETPDQEEAIRAVLADMAQDRPMDRLICGDVGFGKTEVAVRAAFRAVMDGRQVAILVPTTILAQQHYDTFSRRMEGYPIVVDLLSRYRDAREMNEVIGKLAFGGVDIVIGTHRLLQKDIVFKDLGLLVVDEEQRFGVTHKERIKKMRAEVDILTLTATPIPRTLHLAMAGVRDISIIASPPPGRLQIHTIVTPVDRVQIREAILRELFRGGQVFYVYNQVEDIDQTADSLARLVPEAKVGVAHGQMPEGRLEKVMLSFYRQEFNLLVCSTIIENGVDIPSANTIIIHRADRFGLAQLHQLRGRVGRSRHRAYAYLLIPHEQGISADARKRLQAIESLGDLGAGFMLATQDMEIRGAGNILGKEQSGQIEEVGFEMYHQMLGEAIQALRAAETGEAAPVTGNEAIQINLQVSTFIPDTYVPDVKERLNLYKRLAGLQEPEAIHETRGELLDRFGTIPESVLNLLKVLQFKSLCKRLGVRKLEAGPKGAVVHFGENAVADGLKIVQMLREGKGSVMFQQDTRVLSLRNRSWEDGQRRLRELETLLRNLLPAPKGA